MSHRLLIDTIDRCVIVCWWTPSIVEVIVCWSTPSIDEVMVCWSTPSTDESVSVDRRHRQTSRCLLIDTIDRRVGVCYLLWCECNNVSDWLIKPLTNMSSKRVTSGNDVNDFPFLLTNTWPKQYCENHKYYNQTLTSHLESNKQNIILENIDLKNHRYSRCCVSSSARNSKVFWI